MTRVPGVRLLRLLDVYSDYYIPYSEITRLLRCSIYVCIHGDHTLSLAWHRVSQTCTCPWVSRLRWKKKKNLKSQLEVFDVMLLGVLTQEYFGMCNMKFSKFNATEFCIFRITIKLIFFFCFSENLYF